MRLIDAHQSKERVLHQRHAEQLTDLEHRHLIAEVDLVRALDAERRACETRIKHMNAYCNGRTSGMPRRKVTQADYRKLVQQYHLRSSMDNLHEARINVLREKQARQLERVAAKQDLELEDALLARNRDLQAVETDFLHDQADLREEFAAQKRRIVARWKLVEAIERRKVEIETDESHGPLPAIVWPVVEACGDDT